MKTYELPLAQGYVRQWGVAEAVRELIQNAIDSPAEFQWSFGEASFSVFSCGVRLSASDLVLGNTSKADSDDKIGSFGEGFKIALLVLTRLGFTVDVLNGDVLWTTKFGHSTTWDSEVLLITEHANTTGNHGLEFRIGGLTAEDIDAVKATCLLMQDPMPCAVETSLGRILPARPGKLYVGGLYVADTKLEFGYDIKPHHIKLERDRKTVDGFDLDWLAKSMWFETRRWDDVARLVERDCPDLRLVEYNAPELVKEACYALFKSKHPNAVVASSQKELDDYIERGLTNVVIVNSGYHAAISASDSYKQAAGAAIRVQSPAEALTEWYATNKARSNRVRSVSFKALLARSASWRLK